MRTFYISNAEPKEVESMLKSILGAKNLFIDERSNSVMIRDTPDAVRMAEKMVASLDVVGAGGDAGDRNTGDVLEQAAGPGHPLPEHGDAVADVADRERRRLDGSVPSTTSSTRTARPSR